MKGLSRKTRVAWNESGHAHFLTYSCFQRLPLLSRDRTRNWVIAALEEVRKTLQVSLWAYVIMPEHVHVFLYPERDDYEMRRILAALKRSVSQSAKAHLEHTGRTAWLRRLTMKYPTREVFRFWQPGGGFDHNIFKEKTVAAVIEYIHANPVRRGLVKNPIDWEWSSARFWEGHTEAPMRMDEPFVWAAHKAEAIHCSQSPGRPGPTGSGTRYNQSSNPIAAARTTAHRAVTHPLTPTRFQYAG